MCASSPLPEMILMHIQAKTSSLKNETWWAAFPKISFMALGQFQSSVNTKFHKGYIWLVYKNCHSAFSFFPTLCGYEDIRKCIFPTWFHECQVKRQKASITETKGWLFKIFFIWLPQFHDFQEQICCRWQRLFQQVKVALILPITETGGDPHLSVESVISSVTAS